MSDERVAELIEGYNAEFDQRCQDRHDMGAQKYGADSFVEVDTIEMALAEVVDLANYARYTFIRLRLLQDQLGGDGTTKEPLPGNEEMGKVPQARQPMSGFYSFRKDQQQ